ncbi:MAG: insulinase family protein, partial [Bdellovibrionales bacterium]|nr:insulinase family protein [Bdellovibrionales bacterium]
MITTHQCSNGLAVVVEEIAHVQSASYSLHIPGGILYDREDAVGESHILAELTSRGAQDLDSHALSDAFDELGIRHSESAAHNRYVYRGSLLSEHLQRALELVSYMVLHPTLPEEEIESIQNLYLQDIYSLRDNPGRWAMTELNERYYP